MDTINGVTGLACGRNNRWAALLAVVAASVLISRAGSNEPLPQPDTAGLATQSPTSAAPDPSMPVASTDTGISAPDPSAGQQPVTPIENAVILVGVVESVDGGTLSVETLEGAISVHLTSDATIQQFTDRPPEDLAIGQRVTVMGRQTEAGVAACAVIVSLENTSLSEDQGEIEIDRDRWPSWGTSRVSMMGASL